MSHSPTPDLPHSGLSRTLSALSEKERLRVLWDEVRQGLSAAPPTLPAKLLYDSRGARLFEQITRLDAYYPTRTETGILREFREEMAALAGPRALVLEPGSGSGEKTRILLDALDTPIAYVPVDIAEDQLRRFAAGLRGSHPEIEILPVLGDYTRPFPVPEPREPPERTVVFFPGSTIGNFEPDEARHFLRHLRGEAGAGGGLLIGVDLVKERSRLEYAYNDPEGVTAAFNLNVLRHLNRKLGADFHEEAFRHHAPWIEEASRIEMRLISLREQTVSFHPPLEGLTLFEISLTEGDFLVTEHSYKYSTERFDALAEAAGWRPVKRWTDPEENFAVHFLEVAAG